MTILANGQIPIAQADIFTVSGSDVLDTERVNINKITFFNTSAIEQTAILSIKEFSGASRVLRQFVLLENEGGEYLEPGEVLPMENGDKLQALTTTADAVNFVIFGARL